MYLVTSAIWLITFAVWVLGLAVEPSAIKLVMANFTGNAALVFLLLHHIRG